MIYTAAEPALAVLEVLAHFSEVPELPLDTVLVTYELTGRQGIKRPNVKTLPIGWDREGPPYGLASQSYGARFIASNDVTLRVPSVVVRTQWNYLVNPHKVVGRVKILSVAPFTFDPRITRSLRKP
jgi:RES domain-containing protein